MIAGMNTPALSPHSFSDFVKNLEADQRCDAILFDFKRTHAINVNLWVFLFWYATEQYGRLTKKELTQLATEVSHWHERVLLPLRRLATATKMQPAINQDVQTEIDFANTIEQKFLAEALMLKSRSRTMTQQLGDACHNLALYCKHLKIHLDLRSKEQSVYLLRFIFPSITEAAIIKACDSAWQALVNSSELGAQLSLTENM